MKFLLVLAIIAVALAQARPAFKSEEDFDLSKPADTAVSDYSAEADIFPSEVEKAAFPIDIATPEPKPSPVANRKAASTAEPKADPRAQTKGKPNPTPQANTIRDSDIRYGSGIMDPRSISTASVEIYDEVRLSEGIFSRFSFVRTASRCRGVGLRRYEFPLLADSNIGASC
ncbi:hypothetical protein 26 [Diadegma semiclausum ichnovirus]|nr:hypothetical protein 26 [Diadegma semiclausum ichnovirus]